MITSNFFANYSIRRLLFLSALSGILLTFSWPARGFPFLIFFAFIPLFIIEETVLQNKKHVSSFRFLLLLWLSFIIWNGLTTYWIVFATFTGAILAVFINSLLMALPLFLVHLFRRKTNTSLNLVSFIVLWLTFEYLHMNWELSWSWLNLGNAFARYPHWIQWYEITGALGGTLWILMMNLVFFYIFKLITGHVFGKRFRKFIVSAAILIFVIPSSLSFVMYYSYNEQYDPVEIIIVQPNFDSYDRVRSQRQAVERIDLMLGLAEQNITSETQFVVFPEGAIPQQININSLEDYIAIQKINEFLSGHESLYLISGVMLYEFYGDNPDASPTARQYGTTDEYYDVFNAAVMLDGKGNYQFYSKAVLVPGVERMPYFWLFKPLESVIRNLGGIPGSMGAWENQKAFHTADYTRITVPVCYESIYGEYINQFILQNSELILIITNDGWWRDTPGYRQHNQYARLRAIETRRSIARAASTGISSFINQRGDIVEASSFNEVAVLRNSINKNQKLTVYTKFGDYLGRSTSFISALMILYVIVQHFLSKRKNFISTR